MNQGVSLEVYDQDEAKARASLAAGLAQHGLSDLEPAVTVSSHETTGGQWHHARVLIPPHRVPKGVISGPKPRR